MHRGVHAGAVAVHHKEVPEVDHAFAARVDLVGEHAAQQPGVQTERHRQLRREGLLVPRGALHNLGQVRPSEGRRPPIELRAAFQILEELVLLGAQYGVRHLQQQRFVRLDVRREKGVVPAHQDPERREEVDVVRFE